MKNYLITTLGTREIQLVKSEIEPNEFEIITEIRKGTPFTYIQPVDQPDLRISARGSEDFSDFYTISPRIDGKLILANWSLFRPILDWPLIRPIFQHLKDQDITIDILMLVFTDQEESYENGQVKKKSYINNDTVFFAEMIERFVWEDDYFNQTEIDKFGRYNFVADIAVQYDEFRQIKNDLISDDEVGKVYLFPQGGIDQINQALTLRLIEMFEGKVVYLQTPEGKEVQKLDFPRRFVNTLAAKTITKHVEDLDFDAITEGLHNDERIFKKAKYAALRLNLQYNDLPDEISQEERVADLYLAMKIRFKKQRKYNEFLWRAHTLNEVLFKITVENKTGSLGIYFSSTYGKNDVNQPLEQRLNEIHPDLIEYLRRKKISINNPNRWLYKSTYIFLCNNGIIDDPNMGLRKRVGDKLELMAKKRNDSQHGLGSVTMREIEEILSGVKNDYSTDQLFTDLDQIFNITNFGPYDAIRKEIEELL